MINNYHYDNTPQPKKITGINVGDFLEAIENYYCNYNTTQKKYVEEWLESRSERRLALVLVELLKIFSPSLRMPPCIAELEKANKIVSAERSFDLQLPQLRISERPSETPEQEQEGLEYMAETRIILEEKGKALDDKKARERREKEKESRIQWETYQKAIEDLKNNNKTKRNHGTKNID